MELREPLYTDQYKQERLKPVVSQLLLSPDFYCRVQGLLAEAQGVSQSAAHGALSDNSALLQFLIKKGLTAKTPDADVTEEDLSSAPIRTVSQVLCFRSSSICFLRCRPFLQFSLLLLCGSLCPQFGLQEHICFSVHCSGHCVVCVV